MRTVTRQTIYQARRLATQADSSERQAEAYLAIAAAITDLDIPEELKQYEANGFVERAEEMYTDADDLRGQVDTELIDLL